MADLQINAVGPEFAPVLSALHRDGFEHPWSEADFASLMQTGAVVFLASQADAPLGFIMVRAILDEAEVLTLVVGRVARQRGVGRQLVEASARLLVATDVVSLWLEVAQDNLAALALYRTAGFEPTGRRKAYYRRVTGDVDALVMQRTLKPGA